MALLNMEKIKKLKMLRGISKTEYKGSGVLISDEDTIRNIKCYISEALFKYQNDSVNVQDKTTDLNSNVCRLLGSPHHIFSRF